MIRLRVTPPTGASFDVRPGGTSIVVGRGADCDLVIDDVFMSRHHALLELKEGRWWLSDLGSRNGTRLNGELLDEPQHLARGDLIRLSGSSIQVEQEGDDAAAAGTARELAVGDAREAAGGPDTGLGGTTIFRPAHELLVATTELGDEGGDSGTGGEALRRWADRLRLVNEVHQQLGRSVSLDAVLEGVLDRVFDHLRPEHGAVYLRADSGAGEDADAYRLAAQRSAPGGDRAFHSRHLLHEVADKGLAALVLDARNDDRFNASESMLDVGVRSVVAAPLLDGGESVGMIALTSRLGVRVFEREDMELLVTLAAAAALRIRNLALTEEAAERRRMAAELALARRIQVALLPERLPPLPGWRLHGGNLPSRGVSGDFYEVVLRRSGDDGGEEAFLVLADVSGKGMAASLLTASLEALLAPLIEAGLPPEEVAARAGRLLHTRTPPEKYATAVLAVLEAGSGRVRYVGAGHNPSLLLRAGGDGAAAVEVVDNTGPPLGLLDAAAYTSATLELAPGDVLLTYTDGLVEATDPDGEEYGAERLAASCARHGGASPAALARALEDDVERFVRGVPFADDRTLLLAQRTAPA